jgi:hypothetical protein
MNLLKFKKLLNDNDIFLFDSQYRIAHYRLNNLQQFKSNEQVGGGKKINKIMLSRLVDSLLTQNINRANWILQNNVEFNNY